jgi:hypothetical protein
LRISFWRSLILSCDHFTGAFGDRLIYVHNLKIPLAPQYDMPEKYDLARK